MLRLVPLVLVVIASCILVKGQGDDIDTKIKEIFGNPGDGTDSQPGGHKEKGGPDDIDDKIKEIFDNVGGGTDLQSGGSEEKVVPGTGNCECVPYYLCNNGSINTNGEGIIDIRISDGPCGSNYMLVCCGKADTAREPITPPPVPNRPSGCGYRHPDGVGFRITGDADGEAQFGEFPWMVAVLRVEQIDGKYLNMYQCGGALIHPQVVLTAAHCVSDKSKKFKIRAGEWDTQNTQELFPYQDRDVDRVVIHPQYYAGALYNDLALIHLTTPVDIAENVDVICLPPKDVQISGRCFATGWGKDVFGKKGKYQVILKKIELPVVPRDECQKQLRTTRLGTNFVLHKSFLCAGGEPGRDTCRGDGGSPLVCPIDGKGDRYYQAGIVSWGIGCGDLGIPGVYANVPMLRDWIDEQMGHLNLETSKYVY